MGFVSQLAAAAPRSMISWIILAAVSYITVVRLVRCQRAERHKEIYETAKTNEPKELAEKFRSIESSLSALEFPLIFRLSLAFALF